MLCLPKYKTSIMCVSMCAHIFVYILYITIENHLEDNLNNKSGYLWVWQSIGKKVRKDYSCAA